jgi:hypothetical protein
MNGLPIRTVAISSSSAPSNPFNDQTTYVMLVPTQLAASVGTAEGADTLAATSGNMLLPANTPHTFGVAGAMRVVPASGPC